MPGGHSAVVPPVSIPNTEVKCSHVDGSATYDCARVDHPRAPFPNPMSKTSGFCVFRDLFWFFLFKEKLS